MCSCVVCCVCVLGFCLVLFNMLLVCVINGLFVGLFLCVVLLVPPCVFAYVLFVLLLSRLVICSTTKGCSFVLHSVLWFVLCVFCVFVLCLLLVLYSVLFVVVFVLRLCVFVCLYCVCLLVV